MAANSEKHSPEVSGLLAANSGFAVVEAAFVPVSLRIRPAALWFVALLSLGALATAEGVTAAGDQSAIAAVAELPVAAAATPAAAAQSPAERTASMKNPGVLPVVLRGQPLGVGRRS